MFSSTSPHSDNTLPISVTNEPVIHLQRDTWRDAGVEAWHALHNSKIDGVIWHRPSSSALWSACGALAKIADTLDENEAFYRAPKRGELDERVAQVLTACGIRRALSAESPEALAIVAEELRSMFAFVSAITDDSNCMIIVRVEKREGTVENYHRDFGTAVINTLVGPGTHYTPASNVPAENDGALWREDLLNPEHVSEVPTGATLIMRGKAPSQMGRNTISALTPGLWHASPSKSWNEREQWSTRIVLIATSPADTIVKPPVESATLDTLRIPEAIGRDT